MGVRLEKGKRKIFLFFLRGIIKREKKGKFLWGKQFSFLLSKNLISLASTLVVKHNSSRPGTWVPSILSGKILSSLDSAPKMFSLNIPAGFLELIDIVSNQSAPSLKGWT